MPASCIDLERTVALPILVPQLSVNLTEVTAAVTHLLSMPVSNGIFAMYCDLTLAYSQTYRQRRHKPILLDQITRRPHKEI